MSASIVSPESAKLGLDRAMRDLVARLGSHNPAVHWEYELHGTEYFPFTAYASAVEGTGPEADEILVIALQCHRPGGAHGAKLELSADISRGDGRILSESPRFEVGVPLSSCGVGTNLQKDGAEPDVMVSVQTVVRSLQRWLAQQTSVIESALSESAADRDGGPNVSSANLG